MTSNIVKITSILDDLFLKNLDRPLSRWKENGYKLNNIHIRIPSGQSSASFIVARDSARRASLSFSRGERILSINEEGEFGVSIYDQNIKILFNLLQQAGIEVSNVLYCTR